MLARRCTVYTQFHEDLQRGTYDLALLKRAPSTPGHASECIATSFWGRLARSLQSPAAALRCRVSAAGHRQTSRPSSDRFSCREAVKCADHCLRRFSEFRQLSQREGVERARPSPVRTVLGCCTRYSRTLRNFPHLGRCSVSPRADITVIHVPVRSSCSNARAQGRKWNAAGVAALFACAGHWVGGGGSTGGCPAAAKYVRP